MKSVAPPVTAVLIGAGQRGAEAYGGYALQRPGMLRFVAVAEPESVRRERFGQWHGIPPEQRFPSWEPLLEGPQLADAALVCTQDRMHTGPTLAALAAGYHVLLEKPMATTPEACRALIAAAEAHDRQLHIAHVLRHTRHFQTMRSIVASGRLGQIVNVAHRENVSWWHMAHSYVRGNWGCRETSSPMILAKCCHDFDILVWVLGRRCTRLSSFGGLAHFRPENAPEGAPERCLDGCPVAGTCPYYAPFVYVDMEPFWRGVAETSTGLLRLVAKVQLRAPGLVRALGRVFPAVRRVSEYPGWPRSVVTADPSREALLAALQTGPYGRCVYHSDNDVVDHQVVAMEFEGSLDVTLTMHGHADLETRTTRIEGARAALEAQFGMAGAWIEVREHRTGRRTRYQTGGPTGGAHGGGDYGLMDAFVHSVRREATDGRSTARQALESHLMAFAADRSRRTGRVVAMNEFRLESGSAS